MRACWGEVLNDTKEFTFTYSGKFEDGTFNGTHRAIRDDGPRETGTLTFTR